MFSVLTLPVGLLKTNCYIFFHTVTNDALIIDPGGDADFCIDSIARHDLHPTAILATHGHFDHILAAGILQDTYNIPFYVHESDLFLVKRMHETAKYFLGYDVVEYPPRRIRTITASTFPFAGKALTVIQTPGHTPGSVSFISHDISLVFVGDLLFADGSVGRSDLEYSNTEKLLSSVRSILSMADTTMIYPGHGGLTTVKSEKNIRKQLLYES